MQKRKFVVMTDSASDIPVEMEKENGIDIMPLDITVTSLRIEHLIPADAPTWQIMTAAYEQSRA